MLTRHRGGLDAVARALLAQESIDGAEVGRLVDGAFGRPVHEHGAKAVPHFNGNGHNGSKDSNGSVPAPVPAGAPVVAGPVEEAEPGPHHETGGWPPPQWPPPPGGWPPPQPPPTSAE